MSESKVLLMVLIGLPASGKSTLSRYLQTANLVQMLAIKPSEDAASKSQTVKVHVICFDELLATASKASTDQKADVSPNSFDPAVWRSSRRTAFELTERTVQTLTEAAAKASSVEHHLVLIDDNMFYRSMRKDFVQLARKRERVATSLQWTDQIRRSMWLCSAASACTAANPSSSKSTTHRRLLL